MMAVDCSRPPCATTGHSPSTHCPLICAVACSQPTKRRCHGRRGAAVSTSILSARAEKGGERLSQSSPSRPPGLPYALPCQLPPQRGQSALERLANKPSLLIGDPEFWGEVQPPASLKGLDIPSRRADFIPWKPSRRRGFRMGNPTFR